MAVGVIRDHFDVCGNGSMRAIKVLDYDPQWIKLFEAERADLFALLGDLVEDIHHVGSTSVAGLPAKPKIDIDAVVRRYELVAEAVMRVQSTAKYAFHGAPHGDENWTFTAGRGSYGIRLYLSGPDNETHAKRVLFRDWLRTHPSDATAYASLKRQLASEANGDWDMYTGGKTDFVARIVRQAMVFAR
jgi:GrpB-like predicted nucleotidyltransferase (UPF0157 family)